MQKNKLFLLGAIVFTLMLVGVYAFAQVSGVSHDPLEIDCTTNLCVEENTDNVGIGTVSPTYRLDVTGAIRSSSEIISTASNAFRMVSGNYGAFFRNDGSNTYLLFTASSNPYGTWNTLRPFYVNNSTGNVSMAHNLGVGGGVTAATFYDADNAGYYTNPAGNSYVSQLQTAGAILAGSYLESYWGTIGEIRLMTLSSQPMIQAAGTAGTNSLTFRIGGSPPQVYFRNSTGGDNVYLHVNTLYKASSNFLIDHPLKPGMKLIHSNIEGPETAVYYRGEAKLNKGKAIVILPDYFEKLTRKEGRTVLLTAKGREPFLLSYEDIIKGKFNVYGAKQDGVFAWEVKAVRSDLEILQTERKSSDFQKP